MSSSKWIIRLFLAILLLFAAYYIYQRLQWHLANNQPATRFVSEEEIKPKWLEARALSQKEQAKSYKVFHQFNFSDQLEKSGIRFQHLINPDGGIAHKAVHYDHGNGISVADVDSDGYYDIYFVSQVGAGALWRNLGNGQFEDITAISGLKVTGKKSCVSASFADIDNDGDPDLMVTVIRKGNFLFENDGKGVFTDISETAGVNYHGHSSGITFFDYNLDGLLDIFVTNVGVYTSEELGTFSIGKETYEYNIGLKDGFAGHIKPERTENSLLYKNLGDNRFEEVSEALGLVNGSWSGDAAVIDANDDGYPDLYLIVMQGNDEYYENVGGKSFVRKSRELFPKTPWGAMGIEVFDFDNDGQQDIYITDMHSDMANNASLGIELEKTKVDLNSPESYLQSGGRSIFGNAFYKKEGSNQFVEISDANGAENYWPWGLSNGDLNADGFEDVFIASSMNYPFRYAVNSVLLNEKGKRFVDSEFVLGVEPRREGRFAKPWFDLDCDGADREHRHCKGQEGQITIWGALGSRSSVIFDLDDDGDLDIVTNEFNDRPMVLVSDLSAQQKNLRFLKIKLEGSVSNRDGLGAKVVVKAGGQTYTKFNEGKSGYLSQSSYPLYFGLDGADQVDEIMVHWPSGKVQALDQPAAINQLLLIREE